MRNELLRGLSEEQIAKVRSCKNEEELLFLAKKEGFELTEEQLEAVNGGGCFSTTKCPKCGSTKFREKEFYGHGGGVDVIECVCDQCGHKWHK